MSSAAFDLITAVYAKTAAGAHEIQTRALGLPPLVRRLLVLIDGRRSGHDLAVFVAGHDIGAMLSQLLAHGCIDSPAPTPPPALAATATGEDGALAGLPHAQTRSAKEVEMARHFMTNTVNAIFGQHTRLSLIKSISACRAADELRQIYPAWLQTLSGSSEGTKRLPELRQKLFAVL